MIWMAADRWRRARRALFAAVASLLVVASCLFAPSPPPAQAASQYEAEVVFSTITADEEGLTLTGRVTSTGTDPLYKVAIVLWAGRSPILTSSQLDAAVASDPQLEAGATRLSGQEAVDPIVSDRTAFAPGQTATFTVSASWEELGLADGVHLVGVHVRAADRPGSPLVTIGWGRTFVTLPGEATRQAATVVMLTSPPSLIHDNVFSDDHLAAELTGRLGDLLELAGRPGVTWAIDPALRHEVAVMAGGYTLVDQGAGSVEGSGQAVAADWLAALDALPRAWGYRLPWGNPDLAMGLEAGATDLIAYARAAEQAHPDLDDLPLLVRAGNGLADDAWLDYIAPLAPDLVLASVGADADLAPGVLLNTATTAFSGGPGPDDPDITAQRLQRAAADDFLAGDAPLIRVIESSDDAALAGQPLPPWVQPVSPRLIGSDQVWTPDLSLGRAAGPLTDAVLAAADPVRAAGAAYATLTGDSAAAQQLTLQPVTAGVSASWPDDAAAAAYLGRARQWLQGLLDAVSITADEVSLTSKVSSFPVTVTNGLAVPVSVTIVSRTTPGATGAADVMIPAPPAVTIQPGDRQLVTLTPTVVREGEVVATLQVATADGVAIGSPVTVPIHAQMSAWMGWAVVGAAFVLFIVGTVTRVVTKRRKPQRKTSETDQSGEPGETGETGETDQSGQSGLSGESGQSDQSGQPAGPGDRPGGSDGGPVTG